jgi:hypothetical protein
MGTRQDANAAMRLSAVLVEKMTTYRKLYADILDIVAEMGREGVAEQAGYPSVAALVAHLVAISPRSLLSTKRLVVAV